ncbi:GNAT family N-acetyltransferase [bacterium]|nr:GNAT family N-acetyltransferase [bacterium]
MQGPRGTKPEEFDEVTELVNLVFHGGRPDPPTMKDKFPMLFSDWNLNNLRIIVEDDKVVSHIGVSQRETSVYGCRTRVGSIGAVCTHPDYRGRGFATMLLEDTIKMLDADGATVMIISGGRGLYQRAGCRGVGKRYNFHIKHSDLDKFPSVSEDVEIVSYQEAKHLKQFAEIQQREAIRFLRPVDDFKAMLDVIVMKRGLGQRNDVLAVQRDGTCFAYMVISIDRKRDSEELVCRIGEYAGSRLAIISAIKMLFGKHDFNELNVGLLPQDTEFFYILEALGPQLSINTLAGTMRIINFERLLEHFMPYFQQRLGRKTAESLQFKTNDGKHLFQIADEQFIIENEADLVQLILGTPDNAELKIMPNEGKLAEVLREILPLPFVWPGLNFV